MIFEEDDPKRIYIDKYAHKYLIQRDLKIQQHQNVFKLV